MATPAPITDRSSFDDTQAWQSLKRAISTSSGFNRWRQQANSENRDQGINSDQDQLVLTYLRETLETLAY